MKKNDAQLGKPETLYKDTKTNIESSFSTEGMEAFATDTHEEGYYNGSAWVWGSAGSSGGGNLIIYDNSVFKATGTAISFDANLTVAVTGTVAFVTSSGGSGVMPPITFKPYQNEAPATNYATLDTRNGRPCLDFDGVTGSMEVAIFTDFLPSSYAGGGLTANLLWAASTSTGTSTFCDWMAAFERLATNDQDLDNDGFASYQYNTGTSPNADCGKLTKASIVFSNGAQMDSLAAGDMFRFKVVRDGSDTMVGDAELYGIEIRETT